jgi:hypothetical protein
VDPRAGVKIIISNFLTSSYCRSARHACIIERAIYEEMVYAAGTEDL